MFAFRRVLTRLLTRLRGERVESERIKEMIVSFEEMWVRAEAVNLEGKMG